MQACPELSVYVSFLFTGLLTHGTLPTDMVTSTVIPIPKGRSGHSDSDNYRGIALSSIFCKILDSIILTIDIRFNCHHVINNSASKQNGRSIRVYYGR
jgi:hypothetical protein